MSGHQTSKSMSLPTPSSELTPSFSDVTRYWYGSMRSNSLSPSWKELLSFLFRIPRHETSLSDSFPTDSTLNFLPPHSGHTFHRRDGLSGVGLYRFPFHSRPHLSLGLTYPHVSPLPHCLDRPSGRRSGLSREYD